MTFNSMIKNIIYVVLLITILPLIPTVTSAISKLYTRYIDPRTAVAVIPIKGELEDSSKIVKQLHTYFKDKTVKAIVLKMDCWGSRSGTGQAIFNEIKLLKQEYPKPLITLIENVSASGGYYIACTSDYIIATPSALVGSIGVRFSPLAEFQLKDFIEQWKIHYKPMQAGEFKTAGDFFTDRTPEQTAMFQELLNDTYNQFVEDVAQARKLSVATANQWANGKIFTGRQAQKLGLIDQTGSISDAIKAVKEKALIEGEIHWIRPAAPGGFWRMFSSESEDDGGIMSSLINQCCQTIETRYAMPSTL